MAQHIWLNKTFDKNTVNRGMDLLKKYRKSFPSLKDALVFVGYALETVRQTGWSRGYWTKDGFRPQSGFDSIFEGAVKSKHRYARGKNGKYYYRAATRLLCAALRQLGTDDWSREIRSLYTALYGGEEVFAPLHDLLEEGGFHAQAKLLI